MAEVVEYRIEKTIDDLNLLVDFGLFTHDLAREITKKRQNFEYTLRRRNKSKLDYLKYIKFEINILESIENYRRTILKKQNRSKGKSSIDEIDKKLLVLQAKKLGDVVRSRSAHISSLFRKLTTSFQFDNKLWLAYIEFAKSRHWNTRTTALYWRVLRVSSHDEKLWIAAAKHEVETNRAYDTARGLYFRALRHHPKSYDLWAHYFKMELLYMDIVDKRAKIVFDMGKKESEKVDLNDIWDEDPLEEGNSEEVAEEASKEEDKDVANEPIPVLKPIEEDDAIISGRLPQLVYQKGANALTNPPHFLNFCCIILEHLLRMSEESDKIRAVREFVLSDLQTRNQDGDVRVTIELLNACDNCKALQDLATKDDEINKSSKRQKTYENSQREQLYECCEHKGINETRKLFNELEKSSKNRTLCLYAGMIQVEQWQLKKDASDAQLDKIRSLFDKAIDKFGSIEVQLWCEYIQFEHDHMKSLEDFTKLSDIYARALKTLHPSKAEKVVESYNILQAGVDVDYSDYLSK